MRQFTVDEMMDYDPCYTRERVARLWGNRKKCGARQFIDMPIPSEDKIWALSLPNVLTPEQNQAWKDVFVARAVTEYALTYTTCPAVVEWAKKWLDGTDRSEPAARSAARSAAWSAAEPAAWSAAWSAAFDQQIEDLRHILINSKKAAAQ